MSKFNRFSEIAAEKAGLPSPYEEYLKELRELETQQIKEQITEAVKESCSGLIGDNDLDYAQTWPIERTNQFDEAIESARRRGEAANHYRDGVIRTVIENALRDLQQETLRDFINLHGPISGDMRNISMGCSTPNSSRERMEWFPVSGIINEV